MTVKIEVAKRRSQVPTKEIEEAVWKLLEEEKSIVNSILNIPSVKHPELNEFHEVLHSITFNDIPSKLDKLMLEFFYYEFSEQGPEMEAIDSHEDEQVAASTHWILPNKEDGFHGLWESLIYDDNLKQNLLDFAETMLLFSRMNIDQNIVSCNRLILLHGPPGTGQSSLFSSRNANSDKLNRLISFRKNFPS